MKLKLTTQAVAVTLLCGALPLHAADFNDRFYLGLGAGLSQLEPGVKNTGYRVDENQDLGFKLYGGWDFAKHWAAELYYDQLGAATLENTNNGSTGDIDYTVYGLQALYHFYNTRGDAGLMARDGWDFFAKAGLGSLSNDSDLPYKKDKNVHVSLGLGTEYEWANGFALRAEAETFDEDMQLFSLSLLKRFGGAAAAPVAMPAPAPEPMVEDEAPAIEIAPAPVVVEVAPADADNDGVLDGIDQCPNTLEGMEVNAQGCDVFNAVLEGVQFGSGSAELTEESRAILDTAADALLAYPGVRIAVQAHTDNTGSAAANLELSKQRAISVVRYLMQQGVQGSRLRPEAYGESKPRATNETAEGRFANRRVELSELK